MNSMSRDEVLALLRGQPRAKDQRKANLGRPFEELIKIVNRQYLIMKICRIDKVPTAFIPKRAGGVIVGAHAEGKAIVDFLGGYMGRPIAFDAKHTSDNRMGLAELQPQEINGGISFILVSFQLRRFFVVPWCEWRDERISSLRSFTAEDCARWDWECFEGWHVALDYLAVVERLASRSVWFQKQ